MMHRCSVGLTSDLAINNAILSASNSPHQSCDETGYAPDRLDAAGMPRLPVLALGTEDARNALEADQHLKGRFQFRELPSWRCDDYLRHFLEGYESTLPLKKRSNLGALHLMKVIVKESEGVLGVIVERLQRAAALAIEGGQEQITAELFVRARFEIPGTDLSEEVA